MKTTRLLLFLAACCAVWTAPLPAAAQGVYVSSPQPLAPLPDEPQGLALVDSTLYLYSGSLLLQAQRQGDELVGFMPDTDLVKLEDDITYVVRHPATGDFYFTRADKQGRSSLYYSYRDGKRAKTKRIKMDGIAVEHPTFSADGRVMVFTSSERRHSYGGYDLWYSTLNGDEWSAPANLGNRVNSPGDDLSPCVVGDYLFFSSNGRSESPGHLGIYATRLIADQVVGDTVGMLQIGRSRVQYLPHGINSAASDCHDFVVDTLRHCCYWVNAASGLRAYDGTLHGVTLWGRTYDSRRKPLGGVRVTASLQGQVASATSGSDGFYRLTLPVGDTYTLSFAKPHYFAHRFTLTAQADRAGNLFCEEQRDITLDSLPLGRPIVYTDLFGPDAVVDLSRHGIEVLKPLVAFLSDNPDLQADITLYCDLTADATFNALLTEKRLQRLAAHLFQHLPEGTVVRSHNGCAGREGCSDASGATHLIVIIR